MLIYNTQSRKKEEFKPINPPKVSMYICGPTVYNYIHIGNARTFLMSDVIRRYIEYKGYDVKFAMNITDIDDKIIRQSIEENVPSSEVAGKYIKAFLEDMDSLKLKRATINPYATDHIGEIIDLIKTLEEKGFAYNIDGNVFYDVSKFKTYGQLSGKNIDDLESGARIEINEMKKNPLDFSLWKKAKEGEPSWDSPWGKGRPGWHIECSAMSCKHLGETIDIHMGGNDLIFPHHENEVAQSEAATDKHFVNYWMHLGFVNINEEKMSKSLGNFFTAREVLAKFPAEAIRLFFVQTHYRGPLSFSEELLSGAQKGLEKITNLAETLKLEEEKNSTSSVNPEFDFEKYYAEFEKEMDDDFNSPKGVAVIFDFVKNVNKVIADNESLHVEFVKKAKEFLSKTAEGVLGILHFDDLGKSKGASLEDELINLLLRLRAQAKEDKNYKLSDEIRDQLSGLGVQLKDSKTGTTFTIN
ncbi:MAG: cysteine--tRNA ligase [Bacteroidetes bacterium]|nr:cysteine--tRNA ligase [Bacteroidota bacterium]